MDAYLARKAAADGWRVAGDSVEMPRCEDNDPQPQVTESIPIKLLEPLFTKLTA